MTAPERRWLSQYDEGMPSDLDIEDRTLLDVLSDAVRERPDASAILYRNGSLSWRQLHDASDALACALVELGAERGAPIAMLLTNHVQSMIALLAIWKAGAIVMPLNPYYTAPELERALNECNPAMVVALAQFSDKVRALAARTSLRTLIFTPGLDDIAGTDLLAAVLAQETSYAEGDTYSLEALLRSQLEMKEQRVALPAVTGSDRAALMFTGGTTGLPKAALSSHRATMNGTKRQYTWFRAPLEPWVDAIVFNLPIYHVSGCAAGYGPAFHGRHPLIMVPNPRDTDGLIALIEQLRPAMLPCVYSTCQSLLAHPSVQDGSADLSCIKLGAFGAATMPPGIKLRMDAVLGGPMIEVYGLSEGIAAVCGLPASGRYRTASAGLPLPGCTIRIADEDGNDVASGERGEIVVKSPEMMEGYWNRPAETAQLIRDGWMYTADIGYMDDDGWLFIVDRKKDLIRPSGFQVWPSEVEEVIARHPAVAEVAVVGGHDEQRGEVVRAFIVLRAGADATADEIRVHCREWLSAFKVPRDIQFIDVLPRTFAGKLLRRELAALPVL